MAYNGGKNGAGVYQKIISMMPKHKVYIECFLGSGAIMRNKKPANRNYGIEIDKKVLDNFRENASLNFKLDLINGNVIQVLRDELLTDRHNPENTLIYADPPYLKSVRKSKQKLYKHEFWTEEKHRELLEILYSSKCKVMISGYESDLYNEKLSSWRKESFGTSNRAGQKTIETVWMNFEKPAELHDYQYLGKDYREREKIKRKKARWKNRLLKLDAFERLALIETIKELKF